MSEAPEPNDDSEKNSDALDMELQFFVGITIHNFMILGQWSFII